MLSNIVDKPKKTNKKPRSALIDIEDITINPLNKYQITGIEELAIEIFENGLYRPLEVYQKDNQYVLIGGERRYKALKILYDRGDIDPEIPCLIYCKPVTQADERMQIITSNSQRDLDEKQKVEIVKELLEILQEDPLRKPKNMPTVNWIAPYIGCSPRTAQKYKNIAEGKNCNKKQPSTKKEKNNLEELIKLCETYNKKLNKIYWDLTQEEKEITLEHTENSDIKLYKVIEKLTALTDHLVSKVKQRENT